VARIPALAALAATLFFAIGCGPGETDPTSSAPPVDRTPAAVRDGESAKDLATHQFRDEELLPFLLDFAPLVGHGQPDEAAFQKLNEQILALETGTGLGRSFHIDFRGAHEDVQMLALRQGQDEVSLRFESRNQPLLEEIDRLMKLERP
jgi:hypothetical protein